jgi:AcrR family transcriptional regulator
MRALADRLEYSPNFAYRYFAGREEILLALVRDGFARLHDEMAAAAQHSEATPSVPEKSRGRGTTDRQQSPPQDAFRRAAHAYLNFAFAEADLYQLMYGLGDTRVPAPDAWREGQAIGDLLSDLLRRGDDDDSEPLVLQLWATAHGLVALSVVGRVVTDPNVLHAILDNAINDVLSRASNRSDSST